MPKPRFLIVMGVAGSGKTTVGQALASRLGWEFYEGDHFHPSANIAKMKAGIPLDDHDRAPWLASLRDLIASCLEQGCSGVLACSALKERYRRILQSAGPGVMFVYLKGSYDLFYSRLADRMEHYLKADMLQSQFKDLEEPTDALTIDAGLSVGEIVDDVMAKFGELQPST
jgi:gluconokinase